jgi:hypothetical protein
MILKKEKSLTVDTDIESLKSTISTENMGFMFNILSKSYYSRKIESIVREITSNCYDSHIEAGVTDPVIIRFDEDRENDTFNIVFKDVGIGLSPNRILNVYQSWFTSTKRESNSYIGAFGLGSKSPFSYADSFNIRTVHNNVLYEYIYLLTDSYPELISIHGYDDVVVEDENEEGEFIISTKKIPKGIQIYERNGTEIIIGLHKKSDKSLFLDAIRTELSYFDNVYVYDNSINNNYTIYNRNTFMYRPNGYSKELHIVLGKVSYPLDWKVLDREAIELPFGIKFEIGELQVTPNRENLVYSVSEDGESNIKDIINKKIDLCLEEVNQLLSKKGINKTSDLLEYLEKRKAKPSIEFSLEDKVYVKKEYITVDTNIVYTPLAHLDIKIPDNPFEFITCRTKLDGKKVESTTNYSYTVIDLYKFKSNQEFIILDTPIDYYTNIWLNENKDNYIYFFTIPDIKEVYHNICELLDIYSYKKGSMYRSSASYYQVDKTKDYKLRENYEKLQAHQKYEIKQIRLGKAKIIKEYLNHIYSLIKDRFVNYSSFKPSEEWIEEYKKREKENKLQYQRKINKEIVIVEKGWKLIVKLKELQEYDAIVYVIKEGNKIENNKLLDTIESNLLSINSFNKFIFDKRKGKKILSSATKYWKKKIRLIQVSNTSYNTLKELDNIVEASTFYSSKIFNKYNILYKDYMYLEHTVNRIEKIKDLKWINKSKLEYDLKYFYEIPKTIVVGIYSTPPNKIILPSKEAIELKIKLEAILNKLEISNYLSWNIPNSFLIPITSKLKSTYIKKEYLGLNPIKKVSSIKELNNLLLF